MMLFTVCQQYEQYTSKSERSVCYSDRNNITRLYYQVVSSSELAESSFSSSSASAADADTDV